jgi:hypothetical protein
MSKTYRYLPMLLLAVGVALASPACAAQIYGGRAGTYGREIDRRAYDIGFREGVQAGQDDARRGRDFSYQRHDEYRDAGQGRRDEGDRYRRSYREGFQAGYTEAFSRNARYSREGVNPPTVDRGEERSVAARIGYQDGFEAGRNDARDRARFDPVRAKRYREGDHDYDRRYGSRDEYKRDYRAAFEQGYREGYGRVR